ncbi:hypothetical protein LCGC14_2722690, partial [marine sediment metagenome]
GLLGKLRLNFNGLLDRLRTDQLLEAAGALLERRLGEVIELNGDGLEALESTNGLMGNIKRVQDEGEALKPYVFVQAKQGNWEVIYDPR